MLRERSEVTAIISVDDGEDQRSRLAEFVSQRAIIARSRKEAEAAIRDLEVDVAVVAGWYWIIPAEELGRRRFVGIHHSLLPRYRGGSPLVWALIRGEEWVGTSLFTLTDEPDAGPLWGQARVPALDGYIASVVAQCDAAAIKLMDVIFEADASPKEQDQSQATVWPQRTPADGVIDWTRPAVEIERWIRAQSRPYPGAYTYAATNRISVWRATASDITSTELPGYVRSGAVTCGDGRLLEVEDASEILQDGIQLTGPAAGRRS